MDLGPTIEVRVLQSSDRWRVVIIVNSDGKQEVYRNSVRYSGQAKAEAAQERVRQAIYRPF